jgi:hypothetical protein
MLYHLFMKRGLPWVSLFVLASGLAALDAAAPQSAQPAQPLPTPYPESRYQQMSARSPFAVATAAAANAAPTPGFAAQLYVDGVATVGSMQFVGIKSKDPDQPNPMFLQVGKTSDDGMKVEDVKWSDEIGKSTVDVSKGGEKATLLFDEATVKSAGSSAPQMPPGVRLPTMPGQGRPMNFPIQNGQPQNVNRFFPPPPSQAGPMPANNPLSPAVINAQRRRVRGLIQSGQ